MKIPKHWFHQIVFPSLLSIVVMLALTPSASLQQQTAQVSAIDKPGLHVINFDTLNGRVIVNLPDDMAAGDTISGTVRVEPKGTSDAEVQKNSDAISGTVLEWMMEPADAKSSPPGKVLGKVNISTFGAYHFRLEIPGGERSQKPIDRQLKTILTTGDGSQYFRNEFVWGGFSYSKPGLHLPTMGQQGRPVEIRGPFDGSFANTKVRLGEDEVPLLAESPRKLVFESPRNSTGPTAIQLDEAGVQTQSTYRNLGVRLSAPKTNLLKGETTTVTIRVEGLQGIKENVPLHLEKTGVVTMEGGDKQTLKITPSTLQPDGNFTTTRTLTGQQAGVFNVTATVVLFDGCLQDDSIPARVLLSNPFTGDFIFCSGGISGGTGASPISLSTMDFSGGVSVQTGTDKNHALAIADFNYESGRIHLELDDYAHTGTATVQTMNPQRTFTIRDRDTRNNTCTCR